MNEREQSSTGYPIQFLMVDSLNHIIGKTGLSPTVTISKNGGAFGAAAGAITELSNGWYSYAGNATDRDTLGELIIHAEASGADDTDLKIVIIPWNPFDAIDANVVEVGGSSVEPADVIDANVVEVGGVPVELAETVEDNITKIKAAVYDSTTVAGTVITLSEGSTQTITPDGRTTA